MQNSLSSKKFVIKKTWKEANNTPSDIHTITYLMLSIYFYRYLSGITNSTFTPATNHSSGLQFYNHSSKLWNEALENATRDNVEIAQILFDLDDEIISQRVQSRRIGLNFYLAAKNFERAMKNDSRKKQNKIINQSQNSKLTPLKQIKSNINNVSPKNADHGLSEVHETTGSDITRDYIFDMAQRNIKNAVQTLRKYFPLVADQLERRLKDMAVNNYEYEQYTYRMGVQETADVIMNSFM